MGNLKENRKVKNKKWMEYKTYITLPYLYLLKVKGTWTTKEIVTCIIVFMPNIFYVISKDINYATWKIEWNCCTYHAMR